MVDGRQIRAVRCAGRGRAPGWFAFAFALVAFGALPVAITPSVRAGESVAAKSGAAATPGGKSPGSPASSSAATPPGAAPAPSPSPEDFGPGSGWVEPAGLRPGAFEFLFKSGERARGEILKLEGDRIRIRLYAGEPFSMAAGSLKSVRPLDKASAVSQQAQAMAEKGDLDGAISLVRRNLSAQPDLESELVHYASLKKDKTRAARRDALSVYDHELNDMLDRKNLAGAKARVARELAEDPDDPALLEDAIMVEFLIHRSRGNPPSTFASAYADRLRELDPESEILRGVDAEMHVSTSMNAKFENRREAIISTALDRAKKLYDAFRNEEAREVLDEALKMRPPVEVEKPMRELLGKIDGELATERADERVRDEAKQAAARNKSLIAKSDGKALSEGQFEKLRDRMKKRKEKR